jgi:catechol 2,3-dioxygenase-like lactoylglutathione lyase family enzyme
LGMPPYTLSFAQLIHKDGSLIDLIEWKDPYDGSAPYSNVNHIGIARITLQTTCLDADISILSNKGIEFFSEPASIDRPLGSERFVCFKDPDGTIIELVEKGGSSSANVSNINITGFLSANINCSDIEQSRLFYEMLNFEFLMDFEEVGTFEVAAALGVPSYHAIGSLMKLCKGPAINLLEWEDPHNTDPPYSKLNHLGVPRIALQTTDLDAEIVRLKALGVEFFSEPARPEGPLAFLKFVCLRDPDGTVIELVELFPCPF